MSNASLAKFFSNFAFIHFYVSRQEIKSAFLQDLPITALECLTTCGVSVLLS